ncbi:hypothetical protein J5893_03940 [bacterium]|nr:hypothetical protein [bacterium]
MSNEQYFGGNQRKRPMTRREIEEMRRNMKKVDLIHEKAQKYHQKEAQNLEKLLDATL